MNSQKKNKSIKKHFCDLTMLDLKRAMAVLELNHIDRPVISKFFEHGDIFWSDFKKYRIDTGVASNLYQRNVLKIRNSNYGTIYSINKKIILNTLKEDHNREEEEDMNDSINTNSMINMLYDGLKCVQVIFNDSQTTYTYKTLEDFEIGDKCVVDSPHDGYTVVEVVGTDISALEKNHRYKWVVQKIDDTGFIENNKREDEAIVKLSYAIRERKIAAMRAQVLEIVGSEEKIDQIGHIINKTKG
jgi:hypothetical protein